MSFQEAKEDNKLVYPKKLGLLICLFVSQNFFLVFSRLVEDSMFKLQFCTEPALPIGSFVLVWFNKGQVVMDFPEGPSNPISYFMMSKWLCVYHRNDKKVLFRHELLSLIALSNSQVLNWCLRILNY